MEINLTTTGTLNPVIINDLGGRSFSHPTINFNLLTEFTAYEIANSEDLQSIITNGDITLSDNYQNNITSIITELSAIRDITKNTEIWNANKIASIPVDNSNIGDGKVLIYKSNTNTLEYWEPNFSGFITEFISEPTKRSTTNSTFEDIVGATLNITTEGTGHLIAWGISVCTNNATGAGTEAEFRMVIAGENMDPIAMEPYDDLERPIPLYGKTANPITAGTYTVKLQFRRVSGTATIYAEDSQILALSLVGPQGPIGPTGPSGGPIGPTGPTGTTGIASIFGSEFKTSVSVGQSSTTNTSWQQKLKMTTGIIPIGTYRIGWKYGWSQSSTFSDFKGRIQVDDTNTIMSHSQESKDQGIDQLLYCSGFEYVTFALSESHEIDIDYKTENNYYTSYIREARLEIWRIS